MISTTSAITKQPFKTAGRAAIASGTIGIVVILSLVGYLAMRNPDPDLGNRMARIHDGATIVQFLLLIPVIYALLHLSGQNTKPISRILFITGIVTVYLTALSLLLLFPKIVSEIFYMIPQGAFGIWLIIINWQLKNVLSKGLRLFGISVGLGLALAGVFPVGFAIFVDPIAIQIPAAPPKDFPVTPANTFLHQILWVGSILGVLTLPVWTLLLGYKLSRTDI